MEFCTCVTLMGDDGVPALYAKTIRDNALRRGAANAGVPAVCPKMGRSTAG